MQQHWATLNITGAGYVNNYTTQYKVYSEKGTAIPPTSVNGPYSTSLNITRPLDAPAGGWTIEVWATMTSENGVTPRTSPPDTVTIMIDWASSKGGFGAVRTYGAYPAEAHVIVYLS